MRAKTNRAIREALGVTGTFPRAGEKLICVRNNYDTGLVNGDIVRTIAPAAWVNGAYLRLKIRSADGEDFEIEVHRDFFEKDEPTAEMKRERNQFVFAYAITCHKSQGSQWDNVIVLDESRTFRDDAKPWLYTAVTRARSKLTLAL
jgi:exodeoxyribonuclease V